MPMQKSQTAQPTEQIQKSQKNSSISEIDLETMRLRDLIALRDRVDAALAEISTLELDKYDLRMEYDIKLVTPDGEVCRNTGNIKFSKFTHPRSMAESPSTFQQTFTQQVLAPVTVDMFDILEKNNNTDNNINALRQHIGDDSFVAELPIPVNTYS